MKEAIILAGGLGTRLREAVPDLPKCMAGVAGKPFISYVIDALRMQGVERFIFSLGYKAEVIESYLQQHYPTLDYATAIENEPLGTGGAIRLSLQQAKGSTVIIANGDTLFRINARKLEDFHRSKNSECTLALKPMKDFDRYGVVDIDEEGRITSLREKQFYSEGLINGGIYVVEKDKFLARSFPEKFSFEKDYLEAFYRQGQFYGLEQDGYFIDIGIPTDYAKAQEDLQKKELDLKKTDDSWTLFLDRDGVINVERVGQYVLNWDEFVFSEGVLEAFGLLGKHFGKIFVISNQRGVGRQLMTEDDLLSIHREMQREVESAGAHIEGIYYCTEKDDKCFFRKPNPGMAFRVLQDHPGIDLSKTIMVGNKPSDMKFGRAAGMFTVFLTTTNPGQAFPHPDIDLVFPGLLAFAREATS
jgi:D-glycero-alpha-D-manno-heptose 1-phosphate guanylyltransferase